MWKKKTYTAGWCDCFHGARLTAIMSCGHLSGCMLYIWAHGNGYNIASLRTRHSRQVQNAWMNCVDFKEFRKTRKGYCICNELSWAEMNQFRKELNRKTRNKKKKKLKQNKSPSKGKTSLKSNNNSNANAKKNQQMRESNPNSNQSFETKSQTQLKSKTFKSNNNSNENNKKNKKQSEKEESIDISHLDLVRCDGCFNIFHMDCVLVTYAILLELENAGKCWYCMGCNEDCVEYLQLPDFDDNDWKWSQLNAMNNDVIDAEMNNNIIDSNANINDGRNIVDNFNCNDIAVRNDCNSSNNIDMDNIRAIDHNDIDMNDNNNRVSESSSAHLSDFDIELPCMSDCNEWHTNGQESSNTVVTRNMNSNEIDMTSSNDYDCPPARKRRRISLQKQK